MTTLSDRYFTGARCDIVELDGCHFAGANMQSIMQMSKTQQSEMPLASRPDFSYAILKIRIFCLLAVTLGASTVGTAYGGNLQDTIVKQVVKAKTQGYVNQVQSKLGLTPANQPGSTGLTGISKITGITGINGINGVSGVSGTNSSTAANLINQVKAQLGNKTALPATTSQSPTTTTTLTQTIINKVETHFGVTPAASTLPGTTLPGTTLPGMTLPGTALPGLPVSTTTTTNTIIDKVESRLGINLPGGSNAATTTTTGNTTSNTTSNLLKQVESRFGIKKN